jgi:hypothetical protein
MCLIHNVIYRCQTKENVEAILTEFIDRIKRNSFNRVWRKTIIFFFKANKGVFYLFFDIKFDIY